MFVKVEIFTSRISLITTANTKNGLNRQIKLFVLIKCTEATYRTFNAVGTLKPHKKIVKSGDNWALFSTFIDRLVTRVVLTARNTTAVSEIIQQAKRRLGH